MITHGSRPRGRPRGFDRDQALDVAMRAFWEHGFDAVSIADLTAAMGIAPPSLYAAFGDKKSLFVEAVQTYLRTHGAFFDEALAEEPTVALAVGRMLREAAVRYTRADHPPGCMVINSTVNCAQGSADMAALLRELRNANLRDLEDRIAASVADGSLPETADPRVLALLVGVTLQGMSQQARDGASTDDLLRVADAAMCAWPGAVSPDGGAMAAPGVAPVAPGVAPVH